MLSAVSPSTIARSSLEEMLESLRQREEQPKDIPPALPTRPTSRARLPTARRSLPLNFKVGDSANEYLPNNSKEKEEKGRDRGLRRGDRESASRRVSFGSKKMKFDRPLESPYGKKPGDEVIYGEVIAETGSNHGVASSTLPQSPEEPQWGDNISYFLKKKLRVWCRLSNGQWELGKIQSTSEEDAVVLLSNKSVVTVPIGDLLPANPDILEGVDDLIQLSYLNEPSVLHNLRYRYFHDKIYSKAGPVLVAINPFKDLQLCGDDFVTAYREKLTDSPHVYATADAAFNEMMREDINQSIIISGESGAGKTETAKVTMQYFAALGGGSGIEYEIVWTNCILEAFGNAKTSRNDNSSRFGKLIEIQFSRTGKICGAKIQTCKDVDMIYFHICNTAKNISRVVQLAKGERSYHIFYQLCAGAPPFLKERLNLKMASEYEYLKQSSCLTIDDVDDAQKFHILMEALDIIQLGKEDQENIFAMLAAVLWLGNISFQTVDNENHVDVVADEAVSSAAKLMGCKGQDLILVLSTHKIRAGNDDIVQRLTLQQAIDTRDALAKSIYASLFDWLVEQITKSLEVGKHCSGRSISILDIYGFESFEKNSFEQFCINYANERLQQHFNRHLLKLEQEEYAEDGIDWTQVDFEDNQDCLSLFEKKPLGLLSLLDEESNFPKATDLTLANKLKQHLNANTCFKGQRGEAFGVHHYAGEVMYDTSGFLEKNRDPLHSDSIELLSSCGCKLPQLFASKMINQSQKTVNSAWRLGASDCQKQSVGTKFKGQLFKLMQQLENTTPHFIRCIKPNNKKVSGLYEQDLVLQQLRCCGVLEVVRISRSGYPTRMTHQQFAKRYGFLLSGNSVSQDPLSISVSILQQFNVLPEMYQVGYTKLFFRTGQIGALEDKRKRTLDAILGIQKCFRGHLARCCFRDLKRGITTLQSFVRGENARRQHQILTKKQMAVILIQKHMRQQTARRTLNDQQNAVICLQSVIRGWLARRHFNGIQITKRSNLTNTSAERKPDWKISETKNLNHEQVQVQYSVIAELQKRVLKAEAALGQKEEENTALRQELRQFEARWSDYEAKMKYVEEMWQKQMISLQMSLAAAKKSLAADDIAGQPERADASPLRHYYDTEDTSMVAWTSGGSTPPKFPNNTSDFAPVQGSNGVLNAVSHLAKEFEQKKHVFEDDTKFLVEVKSGQSASSLNPDDELRRLKVRFATWKKEFKIRLRDTKLTIHKLGNSEVEKNRKKWWEKSMKFK
ncbi:hypothetical protein NE237_032645 [Protea cynaroides]|uniref:Uncharacterized protein n=1 Tax=Protea cynaroides TaxID=273540 RepID=A0A9Q0R3A0_9MAGN|nr:hypothetical protein NE237_032645 [Protea cynaroides]